MVLVSQLLFAFTGCEKVIPHREEKSESTNTDFHPLEATVGAENRVVLFSELLDRTTLQKRLCLYDLATGETKEVWRGRVNSPARTPIPHVFSVNIAALNDNSDHLTFIDDNGVMRGEIKHPDTGSYIDPQWSRDGKYFVFEMDRPGLTEESQDYDPLGLTAFAVVNFPSLQIKWFPLETSAKHMILAGSENHLYVSHGLSENDGILQVDIYDLKGRRVSTKLRLRIEALSGALGQAPPVPLKLARI